MSENEKSNSNELLSIDKAINENCPWSGNKIQPDSLTLYKGHVVGFCNSGCRDKFEAAINIFEQSLN